MKKDELNDIWNNIKSGQYKVAADEFVEKYGKTTVLVPERLFSDETGDMMSIPVDDGYKRDLWGLRRNGTKNRVSVYHDAPLMTSTARYFLNKLAINDLSTYLHHGCFK